MFGTPLCGGHPPAPTAAHQLERRLFDLLTGPKYCPPTASFRLFPTFPERRSRRLCHSLPPPKRRPVPLRRDTLLPFSLSGHPLRLGTVFQVKRGAFPNSQPLLFPHTARLVEVPELFARRTVEDLEGPFEPCSVLFFNIPRYDLVKRLRFG